MSLWMSIEKRAYRMMGKRAPWDYVCQCCYRNEIPQVKVSLTPLELFALEGLLAAHNDLEPLFEGWDNPDLDQNHETALYEANEVILKAIDKWTKEVNT